MEEAAITAICQPSVVQVHLAVWTVPDRLSSSWGLSNMRAVMAPAYSLLGGLLSLHREVSDGKG